LNPRCGGPPRQPPPRGGAAMAVLATTDIANINSIAARFMI
jgi:hypothetical protein